MSLDPKIRSKLVLPAFCAPMFLVSTPALRRVRIPLLKNVKPRPDA